ncbi:histidinol dehydrogenase [Candidatus Pelagibacter ubique]|nr:histidinol dehydrogenase [Candidatus Pelagibacter ubique]
MKRDLIKNSIIAPSIKQINRAIQSLDPKVKEAIDLAYDRIYKFHSLQKFKKHFLYRQTKK